jgi:hypothetical protein
VQARRLDVLLFVSRLAVIGCFVGYIINGGAPYVAQSFYHMTLRAAAASYILRAYQRLGVRLLLESVCGHISIDF